MVMSEVFGPVYIPALSDFQLLWVLNVINQSVLRLNFVALKL